MKNSYHAELMDILTTSEHKYGIGFGLIGANNGQLMQSRLQNEPFTSQEIESYKEDIMEMLQPEAIIGPFFAENKNYKPSGSNGCFIATEVYGDYNADQVKLLRSFRDNFLNEKYLGKKFLKMYYKYSPFVSKWLRNKKTTKSIVRYFLDIFIICFKQLKLY